MFRGLVHRHCGEMIQEHLRPAHGDELNGIVMNHDPPQQRRCRYGNDKWKQELSILIERRLRPLLEAVVYEKYDTRFSR
jgi:hypothetical protein